MKKNFTLKHKNVLATTAILSMALMATGCGSTTASAPAENGPAGSVLLSVNPEIEIEYDKDGKVLEVEGINDDGRNIAAAADFKGRPTTEVLNELVQDIYEAGHFEKKVGGKEKNIVLKLGEGSLYDDTFLTEMEDAIRQAVTTIGLNSAPMTISQNNMDDKGRIDQDTAKKLLLHQLHLPSAEFTDYEYELDDGVYELEFTANGREYEFEVNAINGKVLEADIDGNDDWKKVPAGSKKVMFQNDDWDDWDDDDRFDDDWDDKYDDMDDIYDDDWDDKYDDIDDKYDDDWDDKYDDIDDKYDDDWDDKYDDIDDKYDDDRDDDDDDDDDEWDD